MTSRSITEWQDFIKNCIDFRPHDGVYRIARDMFTETELFDLEMEQIFEKVWIQLVTKVKFQKIMILSLFKLAVNH